MHKTYPPPRARGQQQVCHNYTNDVWITDLLALCFSSSSSSFIILGYIQPIDVSHSASNPS